MAETTRGPVLAGGAPGQIIAKRADNSNQTVWTDPGGLALLGGGGIRERLTADRTYFVSPTGSDSNDGLTAATPFLTIQKGINSVAALDLAGAYIATVQLANGTYVLPGVAGDNFSALNLHDPIGLKPKPFVGASGTTSCILRGDPVTPTNVVIQTSTNNYVLRVYGSVAWTVTGVRLSATKNNSTVFSVGDRSSVYLLKVDLRITATAGVLGAVFGGSIVIVQTFTISGGPTNLTWGFLVDSGAGLYLKGASDLVGATLNVIDYFLIAAGASSFIVATDPWTNIAGVTGKKFYVGHNSYLNAGDIDLLPGTLPGVIENGGTAQSYLGAVNPRVFSVETMVIATPAGGTIATASNGKTFSNEGAGAISPFVLPAAAKGLAYSFYIQNVVGIRVTAGAGDTIRNGATVSAAAGKIEAAVIGNAVTLKCLNDTEWVVTGIVGTWTVT